MEHITEKRSIVLTKDLAKSLDRISVDRGCSFSALIRVACERLIHDENAYGVNIYLTEEERDLVQKLGNQLGLENSSVIKKCFELALPSLIEEVQAKKKKIEELNRKLS